MNEFIICLIKYTSIFICMLYAYTRLLRIKLKAWDLFDIPLFTALSAVLYFVTLYIRILVPMGFFIFGTVFLCLRFRKPIYESIAVGTISLGLSIVLYFLSFVVAMPISLSFDIIKIESIRVIFAELIVSIIQITVIVILFSIKRFKCGINPKSKNATFDILLYLSVVCIFTMMLLYAEDVKQYMLKIVLLVIMLCGLLLIVWWRRHITYNYREAVKQRYVNRMEDTIEEYKLNSAENDLQVAVYAKLFHYLNKAMPHCALLAESAATKTGDADACAARDLLHRILREMNLANEKCSLKNIPQTGVKVIDAPIIQLFTAAERKNFNASADISANVESWFTVRKLHKDDIHILLSYLCDNAVISALGLPAAKVRLELGATKRFEPLIRIYDSGEQFDEKVLSRLGLEQITTRAYVGGSGIGLFTAFEILAKYGASFTLDEAPKISGFSKVIEIAFDGCNSITVRTMRESATDACVARRGIIVERIESEEEETLRDGTNG